MTGVQTCALPISVCRAFGEYSNIDWMTNDGGRFVGSPLEKGKGVRTLERDETPNDFAARKRIS